MKLYLHFFLEFENTKVKGMELKLPSRLYGEGLEPHVKKINNSCRLKLLELLKKKIEPELDEVMKDLIFSHIMVIQKNDLNFSARLREKNSGLVTWKDDDGFWSNQIKTNRKINLQFIKKKHLEESNTWTWVDRVRLIYLCVIMGVVMGKDEKIWIMEYVPALGEICGTKVSKNFTGLVVIGEDVQNVLMKISLALKTYSQKTILHSFMEFHIDGVVLLTTDFVQKDENKDERVDRILDMINRKHDWNNHVWGVKESTSSEFEEANEEKREDQSADTERGENSHVAENVDGTVDVSGRNKRKHADRGAESRKKCLVPTSCFIKREY
ncbi:hypothetical protein IGI04_013084 [Brassica rapa subsp. trilocularis]|uniref:DUF1985 domain-containing protein n=1 Tax=Brassica rapa subsp. trilocularis TaxID=1813537 RepID=A0ABQ7N7T8_BRACM|nr:hypothetical protein IGI04_013084 [Brassica rapa subsp. trilocularis]